MQRDRDLLVQTSPEAGLAEPEPASRLGVDIAARPSLSSASR